MVSTITKVREIGRGEKVSYSGIFEAKKKMRIGIVPVGYYEGLDRKLSNRGWVKYKKVFSPIIGRICMNMMVVDLGKSGAKMGERVVVISDRDEDKNSAVVMARMCQTIPYEILVKISETIRRRVV